MRFEGESPRPLPHKARPALSSEQLLAVKEGDGALFSHAALLERVDLLHDAVAFEQGAGVFEPERRIGLRALIPDGEHPIVVAYPRLAAGFAPDGHVVDRVEVGSYVDGAQKRRAGGEALLDGKRDESGKAFIGDALVFDRASDGDVVVAVVPVGGKRDAETLDALGEYRELKVGTLPDHIPGIDAPLVGFLKEEIARKARGDLLSCGDSQNSLGVSRYRLIELGCLGDRVLAMPLCVGAVVVAVRAAVACLVASGPWIPIHRQAPFRSCRCWLSSIRERDGWGKRGVIFGQMSFEF